MKTSQCKVRPPSQIGLINVPQSPRRPRAFKIIEGRTWVTKTKKGMFVGDRYMHPRKGWRYPGVRTGHAAALTAEIRRGLRPWSSHAFQDILRSEGIIE